MGTSRSLSIIMAVGVRERKYCARFTWSFGIPTLRQLHSGGLWSLRTPHRLVEAVSETEHYVGNVRKEDIDVLITTSDGELREAFEKALRERAAEMGEHDYEVEWFMVLPHSLIYRLLRRREKTKKADLPSSRDLYMLVKHVEGGKAALGRVEARRVRGGVQLRFKQLLLRSPNVGANYPSTHFSSGEERRRY